MESMLEIPVIGEKVEDWSDIENMVKEVESCGMKIVKILNFKEGSTKFIARMNQDVNIANARKELEKIGWKLLTPYYSNNQLIGFKIAKNKPASDVNAWG